MSTDVPIVTEREFQDAYLKRRPLKYAARISRSRAGALRMATKYGALCVIHNPETYATNEHWVVITETT